MSWRKRHTDGMDVLGGIGIGDFVPWLGLVGKVAGGLVGGADSSGKSGGAGASKAQMEAAIKKAQEAERQRVAMEKAAADARRTQYLLYGVLGLLGVGGAVMIIKK